MWALAGRTVTTDHPSWVDDALKFVASCGKDKITSKLLKYKPVGSGWFCQTHAPAVLGLLVVPIATLRSCVLGRARGRGFHLRRPQAFLQLEVHKYLVLLNQCKSSQLFPLGFPVFCWRLQIKFPYQSGQNQTHLGHAEMETNADPGPERERMIRLAPVTEERRLGISFSFGKIPLGDK